MKPDNRKDLLKLQKQMDTVGLIISILKIILGFVVITNGWDVCQCRIDGDCDCNAAILRREFRDRSIKSQYIHG